DTLLPTLSAEETGGSLAELIKEDGFCKEELSSLSFLTLLPLIFAAANHEAPPIASKQQANTIKNAVLPLFLGFA
ncbi:MAG TPA: hypothetical protein DDY61_08420, partial [Ruminococcaceae bacterium]|nr:hypothetical protein [Oscillospiraceae bacterium]